MGPRKGECPGQASQPRFRGGRHVAPLPLDFAEDSPSLPLGARDGHYRTTTACQWLEAAAGDVQAQRGASDDVQMSVGLGLKRVGAEVGQDAEPSGAVLLAEALIFRSYFLLFFLVCR